MLSALQERAVVETIETHEAGVAVTDRLLAGSIGRLTKSSYLVGHGLATARRRGRRLARVLKDGRADVIVAIAATQDIALLAPGLPVIHVTDATPAALSGFYPMFTGVSVLSRWQAEVVDGRARRRASGFAVASQWARDSMVADYSVPPDAVRVVPFGPGILPTAPWVRSAERNRVAALLVSSDWARKGGAAALDVVGLARSRGVEATLTIAGDAPAVLPQWATPLGRVPREEMSALYARHDVLLEVAASNAGGVTMTDAHAHGLPVIATASGGAPTIVAEGRTGYLVPEGPQGIASAAAAVERLADPAVRAELSANALDRYRASLNWDVWAEHVHAMCRDALGSA